MHLLYSKLSQPAQVYFLDHESWIREGKEVPDEGVFGGLRWAAGWWNGDRLGWGDWPSQPYTGRSDLHRRFLWHRSKDVALWGGCSVTYIPYKGKYIPLI